MKPVLITLFAGALMVGVAAAQDTAPASPGSASQTAAQTPGQTTQGAASTPAGAPTRIATGSVIPVSLTKTIDAKKAKTGDEVVAKVTQDMKSSSGDVLVPKDTKVMGRVTSAQPRNKDTKESQVGIVFDRAVMKNGSEMQMPMSIQAIIGQQNDQSSGSGGNSAVAAPSSGTTNGGRSGMAGSAPVPTPSPSAGAGDMPSDAQKRPPITAQTQGVVGISNLTLSPVATNSAEGSIVTSDKNNVKLESGTMMLLRVSQ